MGRPTMYDPEKLILVEGWARDGLTNEQIAAKLGIGERTLYEWQEQYPQLAQALKKGKEVVDREVENALFKKAMGYTVELKKCFKVKRIDYAENGKKLCEREELVAGIEEMHVPADTTAEIFWLKNRKPAEWRDRQELTGPNGGPVLVRLGGEVEKWAK